MTMQQAHPIIIIISKTPKKTNADQGLLEELGATRIKRADHETNALNGAYNPNIIHANLL